MEVEFIAVLREDDGRGGSAAIHANWTIGTQLKLDPPLNQFSLHEDSRPALLIAGGFGITPIKAMAQALQACGTPFMMHYTGRRPEVKFLETREIQRSGAPSA